MGTVSLRYDGSDVPSGQDVLVIEAIKKKNHTVVMPSMVRNTVSILLGSPNNQEHCISPRKSESP